MIVRCKQCCVCGKSADIEVDNRGYIKWSNGMLVQDAFPEMPSGIRELLISGTHPECWEELFSEDD